jgi:hypothetical protein
MVRSIVVALACGVVVALFAATSASPGSRVATAVAGCSGARRQVETLTDAGASNVSLSPQGSTVARIGRLAVPRRLGRSRIEGVETTTYRINARLVQMKLERDGDIVLVVVDPQTHGTMLVEFPAPACTKRARADAQRLVSGARASLIAACGRPDPGSVTRVGGRATFTGVGFVDADADTSYAAPNRVELAPVLGFHTTQCLLGAG